MGPGGEGLGGGGGSLSEINDLQGINLISPFEQCIIYIYIYIYIIIYIYNIYNTIIISWETRKCNF